MQDDKKRMSVWVTLEDREAMQVIAKHLGLGSESAALRYAVRLVAHEIDRGMQRIQVGATS